MFASRFAFFAFLFGSVSLSAAEKGIVELDSWTFDKIVDGSRNVLVKFDKSYSYGEKVRDPLIALIVLSYTNLAGVSYCYFVLTYISRFIRLNAHIPSVTILNKAALL